MTKNRLLLVALVGVILYVSINLSPEIRAQVIGFPLTVKSYFLHIQNKITSEIHTHINQKKQIEKLTHELEETQKIATLSVAFASKLNRFLEENELVPYTPNLTLIHAISYVKLGDFSKMWLDFPDYDSSKIYGLLYKGYVAGIVDAQDGKPVARLLNNPEMVFSVEIGKEKHLGVAFGNKDFLHVKYIPVYADVKTGDEVVTSGNDNIFYEGIKVGEVIHIQTTNLYKMAIVKPYVPLTKPDFFYAVDADMRYESENNSTLSSDALK